MDSLLQLLKTDAHTPPEDLAKELNLSVAEVQARIAKFEEEGVILGYQAIIDEEKLETGAVTAVIEVRITPERGGGFDRLAARIAQFDEVKSCYLMSGGYDLLVVAEGRTLQAIAAFIAEKLSTIQGVISTASHFRLKAYKENGTLLHREKIEPRLAVAPEKNFLRARPAQDAAGFSFPQALPMDPKNHIARHVRDIPRSGIRDFFEIVQSMKDVISLGIGEPDFNTPWHIREAAIYSLERGRTGYTSNLGLPQLRAAISDYVQQNFGIRYDGQTEVLVTVGVSEAIDLALRALLNPGDEVLYHEPCYVSYSPSIIAGARRAGGGAHFRAG